MPGGGGGGGKQQQRQPQQQEEDTPLAAKVRNSIYIRDKVAEAEWRAILRDVIEAKPDAEVFSPFAGMKEGRQKDKNEPLATRFFLMFRSPPPVFTL